MVVVVCMVFMVFIVVLGECIEDGFFFFMMDVIVEYGVEVFCGLVVWICVIIVVVVVFVDGFLLFMVGDDGVE